MCDNLCLYNKETRKYTIELAMRNASYEKTVKLLYSLIIYHQQGTVL